LPQGFWSEPIDNRLFFIAHKAVSKPYSFEEIEEVVYEDYKRSLLIENTQNEYAKLYNKYIFKKEK